MSGLQPGADEITEERSPDLHPVLRVELVPAYGDLRELQAKIGPDRVRLTDCRSPGYVIASGSADLIASQLGRPDRGQLGRPDRGA